jgi:AbrB family looped-hinge helix DNA binding protein
MPTAAVRNEGQITIPKEVRKALGLSPGHRVAFRIRKDGVVEMRPETVDLMSLYGVVKPTVKGVTLADMEQAIRRRSTGE